MGLGDPIDFEPPVLTLDPFPNPMYVRSGALLTGKVTDNIAVDRVIIREAGTTEELFYAVLLPDDRWELQLDFTGVLSGARFAAEIVAFDKMGNSGDTSIKSITLIIDTRAPVVEDVWIQRTPLRRGYFEKYNDLFALETSDPNGERKANVERYQNGFFHVHGKIREDDTRIEHISLRIYDSGELNEPLLDLPILPGSSEYSPRWLISEEAIMTAGELVWPGYRNGYYTEGKRYYYRVAVSAIDKAGNESIAFEEDMGYMCLWALADRPKGVLDTIVVGNLSVSRGTPLPVEFFDDDSLLWAYAGLLTEAQWNGSRQVAPGANIQGMTDEAKLDWLKNRLGESQAVYNWRYDRSNYSNTTERVSELIKGETGLEELLEYIPTGNTEQDYGNFVLFTLVADEKLSPHTKTGPNDTNRTIWSGKAYRVSVIDENAPLIVFDTVITYNYDDYVYNPAQHTGSAVNEPTLAARTGDSPEENTFPRLPDGETFVINGYTLRERGTMGQNSVQKFRMAWIPSGIVGGPDSHIVTVQNILMNAYPQGFGANPQLQGVQYWDFSSGTPNALVTGREQEISDGSRFVKQVFRKEFNILGGQDSLNSSYYNFMFNGELENDTKLFVFYAEDNMGNVVFRQLRLLGNRTPPNITVYDITRLQDSLMPSGPSIPNINLPPYNGIVTPAYDTALRTYNQRNEVFEVLRGSGINDLSIPFQMYPRGTTVKYFVSANRSGDLDVQNIIMRDITFEGAEKIIGSGYRTPHGLTFCEFYPDEAQRVFLFEASDTLGNKAFVSRTIAATNAARLENLTTTRQNATYGIGTEIVIRANFSGQIRVQKGAGDTLPELNIRYQNAAGQPVIQSIPCIDPGTGAVLFLEFVFTVPEGARGQLETMFEDASMGGDSEQDTDRPIRLRNNASIIDNIRSRPAFIPGYISGTATMPNWITVRGSLQYHATENTAGKTIMLDGRRPEIKTITVSGKIPYENQDYYFKLDEAINITLSTGTLATDKNIRPSDVVPRLQYYIRDTTGVTRGPYNTAFTYSRPDTSKGVVFSLPVNNTNLPFDGELINVSLFTGAGAGNIVDNVGNPVNPATLTNLIPAGTRIYIKKAEPLAPVAQLNGTAIPTGTTNYNTTPSLTINASTFAFPDWEQRQYSLDGGLSWHAYSAAVPTGTGQRTVQARYLDRAGNEGAVRQQAINVRDTFPNLNAVNAVQGTGWYIQGNNLSFNLNFADQVRVTNQAQVTITLTNRNTTAGNVHNDGVTGNIQGSNDSFTAVLTAAAGQTALTTSIRFDWTIDRKEMRDGLYISAVNLTGLVDAFGAAGGTGAATYSGAAETGTASSIAMNTNNCSNLAAGFKVDAIKPRVTTRAPASAAVATSNTSITLTFNEPVMRGNGIITIRPRGNFAIPPVFEDEGYYLGTDGSRHNVPGANRTYIPSFLDIYNNGALDAADRNFLTESTPEGRAAGQESAPSNTATAPSSLLDSTNPSFSRLRLNTRTGQSVGPYKKMTHGLTPGPGYTGNYNNTTPGANGASPAGTLMVPDISTKWVLDYQYGINQDVEAVNNIRAVLTKAKFRWQEIDVINTNISADGRTVTINMNEPLLQGLEWDVFYPEGTFTDMAGNVADASIADTYWFWSSGVQAPVVRVNRRSYDGRNAAWHRNDTRTYAAPADTGTWTAATVVTDANGWGIGNFNTIHYRVESESRGATIRVGTHKGIDSNQGGVTAAWSGNVQVTGGLNAGATLITGQNVAWTAAFANVTGNWILSNLIRRSSSNNTANTYTVNTRNGTPETRNSRNQFSLFRSFNKDLTRTELEGVTLGDQTSIQGAISFTNLEASKSYVVATASVNSSPVVFGYEGVFRTVVAFHYSENRGTSDYITIQGSNIKNGMPSIAGFPVRDAEETGDNRFIKAFYADVTRRSYYWVSTEIMSEWYLLSWGNGGSGGGITAQDGAYNGTHQSVGDVDNYMMVGYGDLTYGYNIARY